MEDFLKGVRPVMFKGCRGMVSGSRERSDSYTRGGSYGVQNEMIAVDTTVVVTQRFFLKREGMPDYPVTLTQAGANLMDGQDVSVIAGFPDDGEHGYPVFLVNHSAASILQLNTPGNLTGYWKILSYKWWIFGAVALLAGLLLPIKGTGFLGFMLALGLWAYAGFEAWAMVNAVKRHLSEMRKELKAHISDPPQAAASVLQRVA